MDPEQIDVELNDVKNQTLAAIVSLEAPNEYDVSHGPDTDWIGTIKTYSSSVYAKAKADQLLNKHSDYWTVINHFRSISSSW